MYEKYMNLIIDLMYVVILCMFCMSATLYYAWPSFLLGLRCHLEDACISSPCHEGASCETSPITGGPICSCRKGWSGDDCSQDINECNESKLELPPVFWQQCTSYPPVLWQNCTSYLPSSDNLVRVASHLWFPRLSYHSGHALFYMPVFVTKAGT